MLKVISRWSTPPPEPQKNMVNMDRLPVELKAVSTQGEVTKKKQVGDK